MTLPTTERLRERLIPPAPPCISVYLPTHRHHPDNVQDPIRFKNLVVQVEASLREKYPVRDVRAALDRFHRLSGDAAFWNHTLDGLAVLAADGVFDVIQLRAPVPERIVVAESFHLKPLLRAVQTADHFHVLGLSRDRIQLWEGDRYGLDPVDLTEFPATVQEALGSELTEPHKGVVSGGGATHFGTGGRKDELGIDAERFFRFIDKEVHDRFSKPAGVPLILVGLAQNAAEFRKLSKNPFLSANGATGDPGAFTADALRAAVWDVVLPQYLARLGQFADDFHAARARQLASADVSDVARAATEGRVGRLLIDADKVIPGTLASDGAIRPADLSHPDVDDLLDDIAERALLTGAEVVVVPHDRMPTDTGLAAVFRY